MTFDNDKKTISLSPSDISTFDWSVDDFYQQVVLKIRQPETYQMHWGSLQHCFIENGIDDVQLPFDPNWKQMLLDLREELKEYQHEVTMQQKLMVDDWEVTLNYRLDAFNPLTGKAIELKFPQTAWTQYKANSDIKTLCYKAFHSDVEVVCTVWDGKEAVTSHLNVKPSMEEAREKVIHILKQIIGHLSNQYFYKQ